MHNLIYGRSSDDALQGICVVLAENMFCWCFYGCGTVLFFFLFGGSKKNIFLFFFIWERLKNFLFF